MRQKKKGFIIKGGMNNQQPTTKKKVNVLWQKF